MNRSEIVRIRRTDKFRTSSGPYIFKIDEPIYNIYTIILVINKQRIIWQLHTLTYDKFYYYRDVIGRKIERKTTETSIQRTPKRVNGNARTYT